MNFGIDLVFKPKNREMKEADKSRIIEMAWEDRIPFESIEHQFSLKPGEVIKLMRKSLKPSSFRMWRRRTAGRKTKHQKLFEKG